MFVTLLLLKLLGKRVAVGRYANVRFSKRETVGGEASAGEKGGRESGWESRKNSEQNGQS